MIHSSAHLLSNCGRLTTTPSKFRVGSCPIAPRFSLVDRSAYEYFLRRFTLTGRSGQRCSHVRQSIGAPLRLSRCTLLPSVGTSDCCGSDSLNSAAALRLAFQVLLALEVWSFVAKLFRKISVTAVLWLDQHPRHQPSYLL